MGRPRGLACKAEGWARFRAVAASVPPLTIKNSRREDAMIPPRDDQRRARWFLTGQIVADFRRSCPTVRLRDTLFGFVRRTLHLGATRGTLQRPQGCLD